MMINSIKSFGQRWWIFIKERFHPIAHMLMISSFFSACLLIGTALFTIPLPWNWQLLPAMAAGVGFFFHMRIFDEIKDYDHDCAVNPDRPLARGLISVKEAKQTAAVLILIELALALSAGIHVFTCAVCVIAYTLIMYREFFIGTWLRPRLATYALFHTIVAGWIALYVFTISANRFFWQTSINYLLFVIASYFIFNIFEFARKTFAPQEEREGVESYSRNFGHVRAVINVFLLQGIPASAIAWYIGTGLGWPLAFHALIAFITFIMMTASICFALKPVPLTARAFRASCSAYIILFNAICAIATGWIL